MEVILPKLPEAEAVRRHETTHATAESWCPTCVKARGRDAAHREQDEEEKHTVAIDELPMVQLDYTFIENNTVLDLYVSTVRCGASTVVEKK